jgi:peptidoglycan/LPS O-acetylase OafA/YrhL
MSVFDMIGQVMATAEKKHGINPVVFGMLYFGSIPVFMAAVAWLLKNLRRHKPIMLPAFLAVFSYLASYLYLIIAGEDIPAWIYMIIAAAAAAGIMTALAAARRQLSQSSCNNRDLRL